MKNINLPRLIAIVISIAVLVLLTACPKPPPAPVQPTGDNEATTNTESVEIPAITASIVLTDILDWGEAGDDSGVIPPTMLFTVNLHNVPTGQGDQLGVDFVYTAYIPTGEKTLVLKDPSNPEGGYIENENGPVEYNVTDTYNGRVESVDSIASTERVFDIPQPVGAVAMDYWVEVYLTQSLGHGEKQFVETSHISLDEVYDQGGVIPPE